MVALRCDLLYNHAVDDSASEKDRMDKENLQQAEEELAKSTNRAKVLRRTWCIALLATISCGLWGSAIPCIKLGYAWLAIPSSSVPSELLFAGLRFFLAGVLTILFASIGSRRIPRVVRTNWHMIVKLALAQTVVQYTFFYIGVSHASGITGTLVNASSTFLSILVAALVFRQERLTARKVLGCAIGFAGVVLVNLDGATGGTLSFTGEGFILISSLSYAFSSALIHSFGRNEDPVALSGYQFMLGGAILIAVSLALGGSLPQVTPEGVAMLIYLAFVSGVAYSLWSLMLACNPPSKVVIFGFINPVFGVILSSVILNEAAAIPWPLVVLALILVCAGIMIVNMQPTGARAAQESH